MPAVVEML